MKKILLYKNGETDPRLIPHIGDYELWFGRVLGESVTLEVHRAFEKPWLPTIGYDGIILSGSPRSLAEPEPWMDDAASFVRDAAAEGVPVLGVCFGHQLLGYAYGGRVRVNPNGWEVGTVEVDLTAWGARDPLFEGLPRRLRVNQSHRDEVHDAPETVKVLAAGDRTALQAIAVGENVRGVQFHPEMDGKVVRRIIEHRRGILDEDMKARGRSRTVDELVNGTEDTPLAERVIVNFLRGFCR